MSQARLLICIPIRDRLPIACACIPTVRAGMIHGHDTLAIYGDGTELPESLVSCADVVYQGPHIGIECQRRRHFLAFVERMDRMDWTHCYMTDADAFHCEAWRSELLRIQEKYPAAITCGYNTVAHERIFGNTIEDDPASEVIWRRVAPGISYLMPRASVEKVAAALVAGIPDGHWSWDWTVPALLGRRCAITRTSYLDHLGWQGQHHPENEGVDGGDRATNPVLSLVAKRAEIVAKLQAVES